MTDVRLSLTWNAYQKNICNGLGLLQQKGEFVDMTIAADGHHVKVHQMIMSLVSPFIKELVTSAQCPHPVIFLNRVSYQTLQSILEYAYTGEVLVTREKLDEFLEACRALCIKGFESEIVNSTADQCELRLTDETDLTSCTNTKNLEASLNTESERKGLDPSDEENHEMLHEDKHIEDPPLMDDSNFDREDYIEESILPERQPENSKALDKLNPDLGSMIQYSLSCQGSIQVVLNRYLYRLRHIRKKSNERMWRCQDYNRKGCQAFIFTKGDVVIKRGCSHNHIFHDKQILKRVREGNMFTSYSTVQNMATLKKRIAS